jgi:hypothetical protein
MQVGTQTAASSKGHIWTGRILSVLVVLFLLFDSGIKFTHSPQMLQICADGIASASSASYWRHTTDLHRAVRYSADRPAGRTFLDRLSWRRGCHSDASGQARVRYDLSPHFRGGALGRPFPAAGRAARASSSSKVAVQLGMHSAWRFPKSRPSMNESIHEHVRSE